MAHGIAERGAAVSEPRQSPPCKRATAGALASGPSPVGPRKHTTTTRIRPCHSRRPQPPGCIDATEASRPALATSPTPLNPPAQPPPTSPQRPLFSDGRRSLSRGRHSTRARWWMERGRAKRSDGGIGTPPRAKTHTPRTAPDLLDCGSENHRGDSRAATCRRCCAPWLHAEPPTRKRSWDLAARSSPSSLSSPHPERFALEAPPAAGSRAGARTATCLSEKTVESESS